MDVFIVFDAILSMFLSVIFSILQSLAANKKTVYRNKIYSEQVLIELIEYLEKIKFPVECFDLQCPVSKYFAPYVEGMTPDLAVINPETMQPLAFFRTYDSEKDYLADNLYEDAYHLNKHTNELLLHPYYVVIKCKGVLQFYNLRSLIRYGKKLDPKLSLSKPMKYEILRTSDCYKIAHNQIINRNKLQRYGKIAFSIIVPLITIILFFLDEINIYKLTELRLIGFGIIIVSILIPYLTQVTYKDFSITFKGKNKEDKKQN